MEDFLNSIIKDPEPEGPPSGVGLVEFLIDVIPPEKLRETEEGYSFHVKLAEWTGDRGGERGLSLRIAGTEFNLNSFEVGEYPNSKRYGAVSQKKIRREVI